MIIKYAVMRESDGHYLACSIYEVPQWTDSVYDAHYKTKETAVSTAHKFNNCRAVKVTLEVKSIEPVE